MGRIRSYVMAVLVAATLAVGAAGCGNDAGEPSVTVDADTVVVDVRTPAEFAEGHLDGAVNVDVSSSDFDTRIATLPTSGRYVVYCRSGNRSAQAAARMEQLGFSDVVDAGGLEEAAGATGLDVTTTS